MLKKAMIYLGLGPDEHYNDYADAAIHGQGETLASRRDAADDVQMSAISGGAASSEASLGRTVLPIPVKPDQGHSQEHESREHTGVSHTTAARPRAAAGQQIGGRPHVVSPEDFHDAKEIGDRFKSGQAVIVNLQAASRDLRRRLVDFSSGLCYGRDGKMDRVADQVYLLTPSDMDYSRRKKH